MRSRISRRRCKLSGFEKSARFPQLNRAIEGHPRHHFRMREMLRIAPHLPDAGIRLFPLRFERTHERGLQSPIRFGGFNPGAMGAIHRVQHFAVNVDLELVRGRIPDAYGLRIFVAGEPWQFELIQPPLAADAIHYLHLLRAARDGAEQPFPPGARFIQIADTHQRHERKSRIAQPAKTVIPIPHPRRFLPVTKWSPRPRSRPWARR